MKSSMREASVVAKLRDAIAQAGGWVVKTCPPIAAGTPDLLACVGGKFIAIECKSERGNLSQIQVHTLQKIREAGGIALVVSPRNIGEVVYHIVHTMSTTTPNKLNPVRPGATAQVTDT